MRPPAPAPIFAASLAVLAMSAPAAAQANRVFLSARGGSDANACNDIASPCQTLQRGVDQVAAGGTVLVLDSGGYGGASIVKAVTVEAATGIEAFVHPPSGFGIQVLAGASDVVVLRGLTIVGGPSSFNTLGASGINFFGGASLHVERCLIQGFYEGILSEAGPAGLFVEDTIVRDCNFAGVEFFDFGTTIRGTVDECLFTGNGFGVNVDADTRTAIWKTVAAGNGLGFGCGASSSGHTAKLIVERCLATNNEVAGLQEDSAAGATGILWLSNSTVTGNGGPQATNWSGIREVGSGQFLSRVNNTVEGNSVDEFGTIGTFTPR